MIIGTRQIGEGQPTYVIAEIGINHDGNMDTARRLIQAAKEAGADAAKFQTYITEKRVAKDSPIFGILKQCELSFDRQRELAGLARQLGIDFFSTPFDEESVDFLASLKVPAFKIASFDIVNAKLLRKVLAARKPVIVSTGMADDAEVRHALSLAQKAGAPIALLHCISSYPTPAKDAHLKAISGLRKFGCPVGYSDHTLGIEAAVLSVAAGACIVEKHFTLDRAAKGPDHALSCDPQDMRLMVQRMRGAEEMMGKADIVLHDVEKPILQYRRVTA